MGVSLRAAAAFVAAALLVACGGQSPVPAQATASSTPIAGSSLLVKPLRLPPVPAGGQCPATRVSDIRLSIASPRGGPTFYLGGPNPRGGFPWNKTVYALVGAKGPVLLRGGRLDGAGALKFDGPPADLHEQGETLSSQGGVTRTFYAAVLSPGAIQGDGSTADVLYVYPSAPGCYALQADGEGFENVVVFVAAP